MTTERSDTTTEGALVMAVRELGNERTRVYVDGLDVVLDGASTPARARLADPHPARADRPPAGHRMARRPRPVMDLGRAGAGITSHAPDREPIGFLGDHLEVEPPHRIVPRRGRGEPTSPGSRDERGGPGDGRTRTG